MYSFRSIPDYERSVRKENYLLCSVYFGIVPLPYIILLFVT